MSSLLEETCTPLPKGTHALTENLLTELMSQVPGWTRSRNPDSIKRQYKFNNYHETMAFANAVAWVAHQQDHHPQMVITWNSCQVVFYTHSVNGLSRNDFICACRTDALLSSHAGN